MKKIKFVSQDKHQQQFAAALRKNVNDYFIEKVISTKGDWTLAVQTIVMVILYIAPFVLFFMIPMAGWVAVLMTVVMGIGLAGIGMGTMHDAVHQAYSEKRWINKLLGGSLYLIGSNVFNWEIQHNVLHHTYTNIDGYDQDIESKGPIRLSENAPLRSIHRYQYIHAFFFYGLMTISKLVKDFTQLIVYNRKGITRHYKFNPTLEYIKMVVLKLLYLFVIIGFPILFTSYSWWQVVIGFLVMHWTAGCILSFVFQMAHVVEGADEPMPDENGVIHNEWAVHQLLTTSDFARNNTLLNWYVGGLNFQIEHHLFPNICHIHYPHIAPIVEKTAKEYGYYYNLKPTFGKAFLSHIQRLKELGLPKVVTTA